MLGAAAGLTEVRTDDLKKLLRLAYKGEPNFPLSAIELARLGLQHCAIPMLAQLRGLDGVAVQALLVAVIAERLPSNRQNAIRREMERS
ncbi:MAG: hypothetical protein KDA24_17325 [Deltaproteobacteria bacterium]|nr:hypothetical protein [Deltaproteobacteria bacterium]